MLDVPKPCPKETPQAANAAQPQGASGIAKTWGVWIRRLLISVLILLVLIGAAGFGTWTMFLRPITVQVAHPQSDVAVQVFGLGTVEARVSSQVGFKISGLLVDLQADVGDRIAKGTVLARLDNREQSAQVARMKAAVEQAQANLQRATASVEKAKANYANAERINERRQRLVQSHTASVESAETAQATRDAAELCAEVGDGVKG
jgi:HlyD family secretion protein